MMSLTKNPHTPNKNFFRVQARRLTTSFQPFNRSLLLSVPELRSRKAMCDPVVLAQKSSKQARRKRAKNNTIQTRARPIKFFQANTDVFQFSLQISDVDIFVLLKQYLFCLMRQNDDSWSYFAFSQTFSNHS